MASILSRLLDEEDFLLAERAQALDAGVSARKLDNCLREVERQIRQHGGMTRTEARTQAATA